jgi:peptide deformylase
MRRFLQSLPPTVDEVGPPAPPTPLVKPFPILQWPDPRLSQVAAEVTPEDIGDPEFGYNLIRLAHTLLKKGGFGLAATQVGWMKRVLVMVHPNALADLSTRQGDSAAGQWQLQLVGLINPQIVETRGGQMSRPEGCLSFEGGGTESVPSYEDIDVECPDTGLENVMPLHVGKLRYIALAARVASHEIDHLFGKTMIDRMGSMGRHFFLKNLEKARKSKARLS